ncbi:MAG: hypothetical protein KDC34_13910 [Saprospiraceae bacterium]|nr:hypothetical protein [Saprospiraceae bacterium]
MSFNDAFNLKTNPFRITPAISSDEIIWAGFSILKEKLERRIKRSIKISNSSLILNWGEYGSGKTHSARYFNKANTLQKLAESVECKPPYSLVFTLPKGKEPVYDIFTSVIDKLDIANIRDRFSDVSFNLEADVITKLTDNLLIQSVLKAIVDPNIDKSLLKKYLYGSATKTEISSINKSAHTDILRSLNKDNDYILLLSGLFTCLTYKKEVFSTIIIWIDEFEDIAILSSSNIDKTNNFLREILDNTPNNLLIFVNLTQSALLGVSDLGDYIYDSVRSRIKERINFELPSKDELKIYLKDILKEYHITANDENNYFPFTEHLIDEIINDLGNVSLRSFNEALSLLLELADMDNKQAPIAIEYYHEVKPEIIGWKNE